MKKSNLISSLLFGAGILLGLVGILLPIFFYKSTKTIYIPKIIDTRNFKFIKNIPWNQTFENKTSDLYKDCQKEFINDVNDALGGSVVSRDKRDDAAAAAKTKNKNYEIKEIQLLNLKKSNNNKVLVFISVIYIADSEGQIPEANSEAQKLTTIKNVSNITKFDLSVSSFSCANYSVTTITATVIPTTSILPNPPTTSNLIFPFSTSSFSTKTVTPTISVLSTTISPFIPIKPIANCSIDAKYVFQDLILVYELNNDGDNKLQESEGIQKFISNILLNPDAFTFNKTKDGIQAMKLLILPYPNPMNFYAETPSFNSINSINDLKVLFKQQLLLANSNLNQSLPETAVCFYLSNLNNQRRGLPTTLILFSKSPPLNFNALSNCLKELQKTEITIILIGVGTWDATEFVKLCNECEFYKIDVTHNNNNEEIIAAEITNFLRAKCSVNIN